MGLSLFNMFRYHPPLFLTYCQMSSLSSRLTNCCMILKVSNGFINMFGLNIMFFINQVPLQPGTITASLKGPYVSSWPHPLSWSLIGIQYGSTTHPIEDDPDQQEKLSLESSPYCPLLQPHQNPRNTIRNGQWQPSSTLKYDGSIFSGHLYIQAWVN